MEDVLDLYAEQPDPRRPRVCFDERPCQLLGDVQEPLPPAPGRARRQDYEYKREGTCNILGVYDLDRGRRYMQVTKQRTKREFAQAMKALVDEQYPEAEVIRVVLDNLSTHTPAAFYDHFDPQTARRLTRKVEFHYTPKHGSWLNQIEIEFSVLSRQCLRRRIPDMVTMAREVAAWEAQRNAVGVTIQWLFDVSDARTRLARLYES